MYLSSKWQVASSGGYKPAMDRDIEWKDDHPIQTLENRMRALSETIHRLSTIGDVMVVRPFHLILENLRKSVVRHVAQNLHRLSVSLPKLSEEICSSLLHDLEHDAERLGLSVHDLREFINLQKNSIEIDHSSNHASILR